MIYNDICFDLDGTITDPKIGITQSVTFALDSFGITGIDSETLKKFIGPPLLDSFMNLIGLSESQSYEAIKKYREYYAAKGMFEANIYNGIPELLRDLYLAGKRLILATSKPTVFATQILERFGVSECFSFISGSLLDNTRTSKEEVIEFAIENVDGIIPEKTVMVGDRKFDVLGGRHFGFITIGVGYGYAPEGELENAHPDWYAKDTAELRKILL